MFYYSLPLSIRTGSWANTLKRPKYSFEVTAPLSVKVVKPAHLLRPEACTFLSMHLDCMWTKKGIKPRIWIMFPILLGQLNCLIVRGPKVCPDTGSAFGWRPIDRPRRQGTWRAPIFQLRYPIFKSSQQKKVLSVFLFTAPFSPSPWSYFLHY